MSENGRIEPPARNLGPRGGRTREEWDVLSLSELLEIVGECTRKGREADRERFERGTMARAVIFTNEHISTPESIKHPKGRGGS